MAPTQWDQVPGRSPRQGCFSLPFREWPQFAHRVVSLARVSTEGQSLESQLEQLGNAGCSKICSKKASGTCGDRPELRSIVKSQEPGAVVVVTRLDRWRDQPLTC